MTYCLPMAIERRDEFMPFQRALAQNETQTGSLIGQQERRQMIVKSIRIS